MGPFSRREFLERSAILSAAVAAGAAPAAADEPVTNSRVGGKPRLVNDRLRVAVVGVRGRGMSHVGGFNGKSNCEIVTVCDCDEAVIGKAMQEVTKVRGEALKFEQDFRKLLEDKSIDIIAIATPNHWHATMAVWAMRAGKDVYVEKPATHNVHEGRLMVEAARKYNKICQVGTQSRSTAGMRGAMAHIHDGNIGKVNLAYATCYKRRPSIGKVDAPTAPPKSMDYDLWCGPAPKLPVQRKSLHYDWHWTWAYGNGDLGNQGVHEMDKARWGLNKNTMPASIVCVGGRFGYVDDGETANTQLALFDYGDSHLIFEVRGLETGDYKGAKVGNIWFGDKGYVVCPNYSGGIVYDLDGKEVKKFGGGGEDSHFANFVKAVRSRKVSDLNCDVTEGHLSAALCHLANISYRLGEETSFAGDIKAFGDDKNANEALARMKDHLTANKVDLKKAVGRVGPKLMIDAKTEQFAKSQRIATKANEMLFREYRKGFDINESA